MFIKWGLTVSHKILKEFVELKHVLFFFSWKFYKNWEKATAKNINNKFLRKRQVQETHTVQPTYNEPVFNELLDLTRKMESIAWYNVINVLNVLWTIHLQFFLFFVFNKGNNY